eukprot:234357_1
MSIKSTFRILHSGLKWIFDQCVIFSVLLLCITIGNRIFTFASSLAMGWMTESADFNTHCIDIINVNIAKPSPQEIYTMFFLTMFGFMVCVFICAFAWGHKDAKEKHDLDGCCPDNCTKCVVTFLCFLHLIETLVYFPMLIHFSIYTDGLDAEFINHSLSDCHEDEYFQEAQFWSKTGVWFFAAVILAFLTSIGIGAYCNRDKNKSDREELTVLLKDILKNELDEKCIEMIVDWVIGDVESVVNTQTVEIINV